MLKSLNSVRVLLGLHNNITQKTRSKNHTIWWANKLFPHILPTTHLIFTLKTPFWTLIFPTKKTKRCTCGSINIHTIWIPKRRTNKNVISTWYPGIGPFKYLKLRNPHICKVYGYTAYVRQNPSPNKTLWGRVPPSLGSWNFIADNFMASWRCYISCWNFLVIECSTILAILDCKSNSQPIKHLEKQMPPPLFVSVVTEFVGFLCANTGILLWLKLCLVVYNDDWEFATCGLITKNLP